MSDTIIMMPIDSSPSRCPSCQKEESIKQVCNHCNFTYPEPTWHWTWGTTRCWIIFFIIVYWIIVFWSWLGNSCGRDFADWYRNETCSAMDVLRTHGQMAQALWYWLTHLRLVG